MTVVPTTPLRFGEYEGLRVCYTIIPGTTRGQYGTIVLNYSGPWLLSPKPLKTLNPKTPNPKL